MADYTAVYAAGDAGVQLPERTGTASADTVPAGSYVVWRNTGAGAHVVTLDNQQLAGGLPVGDRAITIPAGQVFGSRVRSEWGDANGKVPVLIDGTANEVRYYIVGGV